MGPLGSSNSNLTFLGTQFLYQGMSSLVRKCELRIFYMLKFMFLNIEKRNVYAFNEIFTFEAAKLLIRFQIYVNIGPSNIS